MKRDAISNLVALTAIAPVVATDNTPIVSAIIDTRGFSMVAFIIALGTLADADATFAVVVHDGDASNLADAAVVPERELNGSTTAAFAFNNDGATRKVGYRGLKRYVRLTVTPTGNAGNAPIAAVAILDGVGTTFPQA